MTTAWKIGLVEDDRRLARAVSAGLREEGYRVRHATTASDGLAMVQEWNPDLVLIDLMLPDNDGPELFARFRSETGAALVGLSAKAALSDVVGGLRLGADDYVVKPFALEELSARVAAMLRRVRGGGAEQLQVADLTIDVESGQAERDGLVLELTATEFRVLVLLARNLGKVLSQSQITASIWPIEAAPDSNSIEVHMARLRKKLESGGGDRLLHTIRGMGYTLKGARR